VARRRRPILSVVPPATARSRLGKLTQGLGSKFGGGPAMGKGRREELDAAGPKAMGRAAKCGRGVASTWGDGRPPP
jgi:hypothetical protein